MLPAVIQGLIAFLITQGVKGAGKLVRVQVGGLGSLFAFALTSGVIAFGQTFLAGLPASAQPIVSAGLGFAALLLSGLGAYHSFKQFVPAQPQS